METVSVQQFRRMPAERGTRFPGIPETCASVRFRQDGWPGWRRMARARHSGAAPLIRADRANRNILLDFPKAARVAETGRRPSMEKPMKSWIRITVASTALAFGSSAVHADGSLVIYHWFEYIPQELLDRFTEETGIEVTMDTYDSNEALLASLKAGGMGTYDVAVPGDYMVAIMLEEGLLDSIKEGELGNKGNISPEWADPGFDPGRMHSIPYQWGSTSFMVDTAVL